MLLCTTHLLLFVILFNLLSLRDFFSSGLIFVDMAERAVLVGLFWLRLWFVILLVNRMLLEISLTVCQLKWIDFDGGRYGRLGARWLNLEG